MRGPRQIVEVQVAVSRVTVPVKKGATLKEGTARSILRQAGIGEDDFFDAY